MIRSGARQLIEQALEAELRTLLAQFSNETTPEGHARLVRPCHPGVHEVLVDVLGLPLSDAELGILTMFRMVSLRGEIEVKGPLKQSLEALLDLSAMAKR